MNSISCVCQAKARYAVREDDSQPWRFTCAACLKATGATPGDVGELHSVDEMALSMGVATSRALDHLADGNLKAAQLDMKPPFNFIVIDGETVVIVDADFIREVRAMRP